MRIRERFNPRAPCGARRHGCRYGQPDRTISTHAPLAGRDLPFGRCASNVLLFQPTRPLRGATLLFTPETIPEKFQPTRPLRGATVVSNIMQERTISTHAPLAGRDPNQAVRNKEIIHFNPRAPCGARQ